MKKLLIFVLLIFILSCVQQTASRTPLVPAATPGEAAMGGWQKIWEDTLFQAKKEGKVVIYSGLPTQVNQNLRASFQEKTGLAVEIVTGSGRGPLQLKVAMERRAGLHLVDLLLSGSPSIYETLMPISALEPFEQQLFLPEVIEPEAWYGSHFPWFNPERSLAYLTLAPSISVIINTNLASAEEIKTYKDFLKPGWKKRILLNDPTIPGGGNVWFSVYGREEFLGLDFMKALAAQEPLLLRDVRQQAEWLAQGKYPVSLAADWSRFVPFVEAGAPIAYVETQELDYLTAGASFIILLRNAPHPSASKLFLNWIFSKEGSLIVQRTYERQSVRLDTGKEGLDRTKAFRVERKKYFNAATEEFDKLRDSLYNAKAKDIFSLLLR